MEELPGPYIPVVTSHWLYTSDFYGIISGLPHHRKDNLSH